MQYPSAKDFLILLIHLDVHKILSYILLPLLDKHKCACYHKYRTSTNVHVTMKVVGDMRNNLKSIREKKGFTQVQVAEKAQLSERGYRYIEAGQRLPNVIIAQKLAHVLNATVEDMFPLSGEK